VCGVLDFHGCFRPVSAEQDKISERAPPHQPHLDVLPMHDFSKLTGLAVLHCLIIQNKGINARNAMNIPSTPNTSHHTIMHQSIYTGRETLKPCLSNAHRDNKPPMPSSWRNPVVIDASLRDQVA
jgi:hypothetical protein